MERSMPAGRLAVGQEFGASVSGQLRGKVARNADHPSSTADQHGHGVRTASSLGSKDRLFLSVSHSGLHVQQTYFSRGESA